ncbi:hypothetical protein [Parageobacillus thermoglucosidasius]|uniref:hypothetical protein n=1 Tax=Parageobacillus thermoglucosidasius TaxID=1426 RepID=UPI00025B590A|nr:hypothetical protein [Parageobacillus thermoglucosidasius]EID45261.1 hypothetical protein GT20_0831 [Parageobacillus thermoglucosidasius TNO-09.020]KYD13932.1 hypothetical protein B4168_0753 [Anoxybacillus flavithermus]OAO86763.1 hypothetical protein GT23_1781 [Parageobacillus thermoglucosidasius]
MNEKGHSLVVTMLIITIFLLLGLTIMSVAIYQARFTEVRVEDVESFHEATKAIEETIAEMKTRIEDFDMSTEDLDSKLDIEGLQNRYGVKIEDVTSNYIEASYQKKLLFTRVYIISYDIKDKDSHKTYKTVERRVIVTSTPSFLKYALGSQENVVLNGGAYIEGNIYAGKNAYMTNVANYIDFDNNEYMEPTSFPTTSKNSVLFVNGSYFSCDHDKNDCYDYNVEDNAFQCILENYSNDVRFQSQAPSIRKEREEFIDVDFEWTVKDKLLNAAGETFNEEQKYKSIAELFDELKNKFDNVDFESVSELQKKINSTNQSIILRPKDSSEISLGGEEPDDKEQEHKEQELNLRDRWLIVDGDLFLNGINEPITIKRGNIIVFGNLRISGDVKLDSTVYVFGPRNSPDVPGRTLIYNANINITGDKVVVLLSRGPLEIARINEFENNLSLKPPNLKGYFYTESSATVYAVGSYINIQGGLFARGDTSAPDFDVSGLVINAYRGQVKQLKLGNPLNFTPPKEGDDDGIEQSRFVVSYEPRVFIDRVDGLPFVKKLSLIVDKLTVK